MLQQTRAAVVGPYYLRFLERFPDVHRLAAAERSEVLAAWAGLGYYRRAHNLHEAARRIVKAGRFPQDAAEWRALPGIGEYTAAAIASIAFGRPVPALDANGFRVLSRLLAETRDIGQTGTRQHLASVARRLLDPSDPGSFNQALMDLGSMICLPKVPRCRSCPLVRHCRARQEGIETRLPRRRPRAERIPVEAQLLWAERNGRILLRRLPQGRLEGFWELPSREAVPTARLGGVLAELRHSITRYDYRIRIVRARVDRTPPGSRWMPLGALPRLPLSTITRKALAAVGRG